jgi:hypothetical protein
MAFQSTEINSLDLWKLPSNRLADEVSQSFEHQLYSRYPPEERPPHLREALPSRKKFDRSLIWSIHATYWRRWWLAGFMRLVASVGPTLTALVTRELLAWLSASHAWHRADDETRQQVCFLYLLTYLTILDILVIACSSSWSCLWYWDDLGAFCHAGDYISRKRSILQFLPFLTLHCHCYRCRHIMLSVSYLRRPKVSRLTGFSDLRHCHDDPHCGPF